jgi:hypothetical protein
MSIAWRVHEFIVLTIAAGISHRRSSQSYGGPGSWTRTDILAAIPIINTNSIDSDICCSNTLYFRCDASKGLYTLLDDATFQPVRAQITDEAPWITTSLPRLLLHDPRRHDCLGYRGARSRVGRLCTFQLHPQSERRPLSGPTTKMADHHHLRRC